MPIPFLLIGLGVATAAVGVGKSIKAAVDMSDAKDLNNEANSIIEEAKFRINKARENTNNSLKTLGREKLNILSTSVSEFLVEFRKIKNVHFRSSIGTRELLVTPPSEKELMELKMMSGHATSILGGIGGGALGGALTAFGAYSAAGTFAAASTGTAIASLSGAAATNATLAFFGGGSLAAGGLGMAGGTMVLGGLVAGPALAIMGFIVGAKASTELNKAYENRANARKFEAEVDVAVDMCNAIAQRADMFTDLLLKLNNYAITQINVMRRAINLHADFRYFNADEQKATAAAVAVINSIKAVIDTPILTEDGNLTNASANVLRDTPIPNN